VTYVLDADALIESKKRWYAFDICPAYWDWLDQQFQSGAVCSVEKVLEEIRRGGDDLSTWCDARSQYFCSPNSADLSAMARVAAWATNHQHYVQAAATTFLSAGDSYVVAHAIAIGGTVVTLEQSRNQMTKIKVPDACNELGVPVMTPFDMLRQTGTTFNL
jgi:hypothetical protein